MCSHGSAIWADAPADRTSTCTQWTRGPEAGLPGVSVPLPWLLHVTSAASPPAEETDFLRASTLGLKESKWKSPGLFKAQARVQHILLVTIQSPSRPRLQGGAGQSCGHGKISFNGARAWTVQQTH